MLVLSSLGNTQHVCTAFYVFRLMLLIWAKRRPTGPFTTVGLVIVIRHLQLSCLNSFNNPNSAFCEKIGLSLRRPLLSLIGDLLHKFFLNVACCPTTINQLFHQLASDDNRWMDRTNSDFNHICKFLGENPEKALLLQLSVWLQFLELHRTSKYFYACSNVLC